MQQDIAELFAILADYALLHSRIDQVNQALAIVAGKNSFSEVESYQLQLFANILDKQRSYSIKEYPEFLVYEYATQRLLRVDQVAILTTLIKLIEGDATSASEMHHALLQFAAGGGKTAVLIPLLAQRFARKGFLPVIFNTNELYQIGLEEIPKNLRTSFQQNLEVIECELEHKWTAQELQKLLKDLKRWQSEGKCLLIKPVTWHSINITMKAGYLKCSSGIAKAAQAVLDFFKTKAVKLEDECHIISDPMQQSIEAAGLMQKIANEQLELLLRFYDYLISDESAGIKSNRKRSITPKELSTLQENLAAFIVDEEAFTAIDRNELKKYLLQPEKVRPQWLNDLYYGKWDGSILISTGSDKKTANLIVLARAFIKTHLPHILSLQYQKDYGASIHSGDLTVAPKHEGKDVTSHFGDHTLVAALTVQFYQQRGLLPLQVEQLLDQVIKEHKQERSWNHDFSIPTQAEQWLMRLIPAKYSFISYRDLTPIMITRLSQDSNFCHNQDVLKKYLREFALPQIQVASERYTSTAAELQAGFTRSLLLSATPSLAETYPAFLEDKSCFFEEAFEAQVIDTLLQSQNSGIYQLESAQSPGEFFQQFPPDLLKKMTTLIDRGALLTSFEAKNVIAAYFELDEHRVKQTAAFFADKSLYLKSRQAKVKEKLIPGAGLVAELEKQGLDPKEFLLFLFLDLSKTTGTDIKRPYDDHGVLTVGIEQTVTETIQAAMRLRQLLDDNAQSITWLMFKSLYQEICHTQTVDARQIFYWLIKNEAKKIEIKLINRAYQGIYQALSAVAWQEKTKYWWKLRQEQELDPYLIYEIASEEKDTVTVLRGYQQVLN